MRPKVVHRFYEPLVLLKALNLEMMDTATYINPGESEYFHDPQKLFQTFVYKLAHVCDSVKGNGGFTITSIAVLQGKDDRTIEYWFASNQRTEQELNTTASFVRSLLQTIKKAPVQPCQQTRAIQKVLLHDVLLFNRERISFYLKNFRIEAQKCIDRWPTLSTDDCKIMLLAWRGTEAYSRFRRQPNCSRLKTTATVVRYSVVSRFLRIRVCVDITVS